MNVKEKVQAAFSAAAPTYEREAGIQAHAAARLAALVGECPVPASPRVLEVGCGTGLLTRALMPRMGGDWLVTDLSPSMVEAARGIIPGARFAVMDGEHPQGHDYDLVVSSLAAQWFGDLGAALARLAATLRPGGILAVSTLGADSFAQWRDAHASLGLACGLHSYPDAHALAALAPPGAKIVSERLEVDYADGLAFARALKAIGAGTPAPGHRPLPPGLLRRVAEQAGRPCVMTYHLLYVLWIAE